VLAGLDDRKRYGLALFRRRVASKVLLSVSRFEIRRLPNLSLPVPLDLLTLASKIPAPQRHFFVLFDGECVEVNYVKPKRFGTLTEIEALMHWLKDRPEIQSLAIVSSNSHLRRIQMCCKLLLPRGLDLKFVAVPESAIRSLHFYFVKSFGVETCKTILYWFILKFRRYK
jgi:hypothetical protein